jgi:hypothetical protein
VSSAILYGAIVVIWAAVLIPRWLRRGESFAPAEETPVAEGAAPSASPTSSAGATGSADAAPPADAAPIAEAPRRVPERASPDRARVIGARRRLLGMLVALAFGAWVLAVTGLAAWWVILPPSVMLAGYLVLLREASRADAERRSSQRARPPARRTGVDGTVAPEPVAPEPVAPEPVTPGRVAASGLARAEAGPAADAEVIDITERVGEEFYDQYADAKLRAVGD